MQSIQSAQQNRLVVGADLSNVHVGVCEPCIKHCVSMKANESVRITSKEKPHVPMQSVQSYLLFAIVTAKLK